MLRSYVAGAWRDGDEVAARTNPAHPDEVVSEVSLAGAGIALDAIAAARAAFPAWRALPSPARGDILRRAADILERRVDDVGRDLTREEGKTVGEAVGETRRAVAILRYYAGQVFEPDGETYPSHAPRALLYARREPVGVAAVITPWNFPIAIPAWKIAPALAYGNTVVWKPAELVPLTATHLLEALVEAGLPAGVLDLVLGRGRDVGDALVDSREVDAISFTGSNAVGRAIQARAVARGARVQLEMGGKNPAIVLADADIDHAAEQVARGAFLSAGEKCTATSRVIVEAGAEARLREALVARAESWTVGDPLLPGTMVGPLVSDAQRASVLGRLASVVPSGGRMLAGSRATPRDGHYVPLTVVADLPAGHPVSREEIFGPVTSLVTAASFDEAIRLANDTPFGLVASLFTNDLDKAMRFADEIQAGVVKVNQETAGLEFQVPFGGTKESSSGSREQGKVARDFYTEWKTVYLIPRGPAS